MSNFFVVLWYDIYVSMEKETMSNYTKERGELVYRTPDKDDIWLNNVWKSF